MEVILNMGIKIDHAKTAFESFSTFFEGIFSSIKPRRKIIGKIEKLRKKLIDNKDLLIQNLSSDQFINRTIEKLNDFRRDYSDLNPSIEIFNYCSNFLRFIEKNILLKTEPKKIFLELKKIFSEIFSQIDYKITRNQQILKNHAIEHLKELINKNPVLDDEINIILADLKKINNNNCFSLIYLVRVRNRFNKFFNN